MLRCRTMRQRTTDFIMMGAILSPSTLFFRITIAFSRTNTLQTVQASRLTCSGDIERDGFFSHDVLHFCSDFSIKTRPRRWRLPTLPLRVPSVLESLTAVFGMGTGMASLTNHQRPGRVFINGLGQTNTHRLCKQILCCARFRTRNWTY